MPQPGMAAACRIHVVICTRRSDLEFGGGEELDRLADAAQRLPAERAPVARAQQRQPAVQPLAQLPHDVWGWVALRAPSMIQSTTAATWLGVVMGAVSYRSSSASVLDFGCAAPCRGSQAPTRSAWIDGNPASIA